VVQAPDENDKSEVAGDPTASTSSTSRTGDVPAWHINDKWVYKGYTYDPNMVNYEQTTIYEILATTTVTVNGTDYDVFEVNYTDALAYTYDGGTYTYNYYCSTTGTYYYRQSDIAVVSWQTCSDAYTVTSSGTTHTVTYSEGYYTPPEDAYEFPINLDESWNVTFNYTYSYHGYSESSAGTTPFSGGGNYAYTSYCSCTSEDEVDTEAGTFTAYKIEMYQDSGYGVSHTTIFWSSNAGNYVKSYYYDQYDNPTGYSELSESNYDAPPIVSNPILDFSIPEDSVDSTTVNLNDVFSDPNGASLNFGYYGNEHIDVSINDATGYVTFTPKQDWNGAETITFTASDGVNEPASTSVTVTVTPINDPPVISEIPDIEFLEDTHYDGLDLDEYVSDVDTEVSAINWFAIGNISVMIDIDPITHVVIFSAPKNWFGEDTVTFVADDGMVTSESNNILVTVTSVNDLPEVGYWIPEMDEISIEIGDKVTFMVIDCSDADGSSPVFEWFVDDAIQSSVTGNKFVFDSDGIAVGTYNVKVVVIDADDNTVTIERLWLVIVNPNSTIDTDCDGVPDIEDQDDDGDEMPDDWECEQGLNPLDASDADGDPDNDGYTNLEEYQSATDPRDPSSYPANIGNGGAEEVDGEEAGVDGTDASADAGSSEAETDATASDTDGDAVPSSSPTSKLGEKEGTNTTYIIAIIGVIIAIAATLILLLLIRRKKKRSVYQGGIYQSMYPAYHVPSGYTQSFPPQQYQSYQQPSTQQYQSYQQLSAQQYQSYQQPSAQYNSQVAYHQPQSTNQDVRVSSQLRRY
jgi:hypothetical protein